MYIESAKIVNEMTLNELVKLTTLWTTGPRISLPKVKILTSRNMNKHTFGHPSPEKIQISLRIRVLDSQGCKVSSCEQYKLLSDCMDAQAELSSHLAHI